MPLVERAVVPMALCLGTAALAAITLGTRPADPSPPTTPAPAAAATLVRLGPPSPTGVARYRPGAHGDLHVAMVDATGTVRWERDVPPDSALPLCGPCPAAWLPGTPGPGIVAVDADGTPTGPPAGLPPAAVVRTLGVAQPVLLVDHPSRVALWTLTRQGPAPLAEVAPEVVADPRTRASAAADGSAVTLVGPHRDPLRLAEARVTHVTATGTTGTDVAVPDATTRIHPCVPADRHRWGYLLASLGDRPGTEQATLVTVGPEGERRTALPTFLDACTVGPVADLAWTTTIGRPGGPPAALDLVVVQGDRVDARSRAYAAAPSVAADPARALLVVADGTTTTVLEPDGGERPLPPADAVAVDVDGGVWLARAEPAHVERLAAPTP